jgi:hypothetical protein
MFALVLQIFFGKEHLVKIGLSPPYLDKVINFKGTIFQGSTNPLFTSQNRVGISSKKSSHFQTCFF